MKPIHLAFVITATALGQTNTAGSPEAAIRQADEAWLSAITSKSVEAAVAAYDPDVLTAGSAMPPARGLEGVRAMWTKLFSRPEFSLFWKTDNVVISDSGTIATVTGTWSQAASSKVSGLFIAVWRKQQDGKWKVLVDAAWNPQPPQ
jgi:ketosteroid isomerase-like protein